MIFNFLEIFHVILSAYFEVQFKIHTTCILYCMFKIDMAVHEPHSDNVCQPDTVKICCSPTEILSPEIKSVLFLLFGNFFRKLFSLFFSKQKYAPTKNYRIMNYFQYFWARFSWIFCVVFQCRSKFLVTCSFNLWADETLFSLFR